MSTSRLRLQYLFERHYSKTATPQERAELFAVINASNNDEELSALIKKSWDDLDASNDIFGNEKSERMLQNVLRAEQATPVKPIKNKFRKWMPLLAAAILLITGVALYQRDKSVEKPKPLVTKKKQPLNDALPGGNKAILTLANGKTITLDDAADGTIAEQGNTLVKKTAEGQIIYNTAALDDANSPPVLNTITTPRGGQYQIALPDGTQAWLNSASSITFPTRFTGNNREISITGEVYFEVTKNKHLPFEVKTHRATIEVLGTHFNVMAYDDEQVMKTTLLEGAVKISNGNFTAQLKPGQQAQTTSKGDNKVLNDVDLDDEIAWKNGIFQFRDAKIDVILRQAARWYDVDIKYNHQIPNKEFNGRISRNVKASQLLEMLKYAGLDISIKGNSIIVN
ncbi:FecR family protein [Mucilaginibacter achroorhodeus]|uniref:FecR family protein n=1 Tax=Mucilaginibacter achroorhodeus TaxID=2599294 RepID=A0A563U696_9SPHI|nr:FecR family protein [Mucilaginibacter achroorhodeus]TWR26855.1 FecR family protein [Mucilaginibacter achroorhodeus]